MGARTVIAGLDLSLTASAIVTVPTNWDSDWKRVKTNVVGRSLPRGAIDADRIDRCVDIATTLARHAKQRGVKRAYIEGYAFSRTDQAHSIGELGGIVRYLLAINGIEFVTANMNTARKLLLGKVPRKGPKEACWGALAAAGAPAWSLDESDAFVCANLGLSEYAGAYCFAQAEAA